MSSAPPLAAALAGVPVAIQQLGVWGGRRQLFIKFAGPAETAMMYTADALVREIKRALEKSRVHSICVTGRDALANDVFLMATLEQLGSDIPVMVETDGQRPSVVEKLRPFIQLLQVSVETSIEHAALERVGETLMICDRLGLESGLAVLGRDAASDSDYLRIVDHAVRANAKTRIVLHPGPGEEKKPLDRRWSLLSEQATARPADVRVALRLSGPVTQR